MNSKTVTDNRQRSQRILYVSQYGDTFTASTLKELKGKVGPGRVSKMYVDKIAGPLAGQTVCVGYVIGQLWLSSYVPLERAA